MKYLKIENGKGLYTTDGATYHEISVINKEDLLKLVDYATQVEVNFEIDVYTDQSINNEAHKIIYSNIYNKFKELCENKDRFRDESSKLYQDAIDKYKM